jgi:hypothetical protein
MSQLSTVTTADDPPGIGVGSRPSLDHTKILLACGVVGGPLFIVAALAQAFTRSGFDLRHQVISMLSLGDLGWIQIANFVVSGLLALALAVGVRRALHPGRAGTWGPLLIGAYGVGFISAGLFHPDPAFGFPPGAPAGMPTVTSGHAIVHNLSFFVAFIGLIAACLVFARREAGLGHRGWAVYCVVTGASAPVLIAVASAGLLPSGVVLAVLGAVTSGWIGVVSARMVRQRDGARAVMD